MQSRRVTSGTVGKGTTPSRTNRASKRKSRPSMDQVESYVPSSNIITCATGEPEISATYFLSSAEPPLLLLSILACFAESADAMHKAVRVRNLDASQALVSYQACPRNEVAGAVTRFRLFTSIWFPRSGLLVMRDTSPQHTIQHTKSRFDPVPRVLDQEALAQRRLSTLALRACSRSPSPAARPLSSEQPVNRRVQHVQASKQSTSLHSPGVALKPSNFHSPSRTMDTPACMVGVPSGNRVTSPLRDGYDHNQAKNQTTPLAGDPLQRTRVHT